MFDTHINSKLRVLAAVGHWVSDRVAITFDAEMVVYDLLYEHFNVWSKEKLFDRLNVDTWMLIPGGFGSSLRDALGQKESIWGYKTTMAQYSGGEYEEICYWPLAGKDSLSDIDKWEAPTIGDIDFSGFSAEAEAHKDRAIIGAFAHGAYFTATDVRGMENLMMDFAVNRSYAHKLIDKIAECVLGYLDNMLENHGDGIDIVYMADDYCSQRSPLFSPADFNEFVKPYLTKVVEKVHRYNKNFLLH